MVGDNFTNNLLKLLPIINLEYDKRMNVSYYVHVESNQV